MRMLIASLVFWSSTPVMAGAVVCDPLRPADSRCYRVEDLARLVVPPGHCVSIVEIDGKPSDRVECNRSRAAPADATGMSSKAAPARPSGRAQRPELMRATPR